MLRLWKWLALLLVCVWIGGTFRAMDYRAVTWDTEEEQSAADSQKLLASQPIGTRAPVVLEEMEAPSEAMPMMAMYDAGVVTSRDEYAPLSDPGFVLAQTSPLSTFAADVDTATYANIRRLILAQEPIPADAVRVEEMVNAFSGSYSDPAPEGGEVIRLGGEVGVCPWNEEHLLMRVNLTTQSIETEALPPSNLVFLIDTSGSMDEPNKLPLVQRSFALLVAQLDKTDRVSIVTYAGNAQVVLEGARGDETARILTAITELYAGGATHGAQGIDTAYAIAEQYAAPGMNSRVILATDGDFNVGAHSEGELIRLIEDKRDSGIFLTVLGFGNGNYKDNRLQALAGHGNGNAAYIDTIHEARRALVDEMGATLVTVAKDVKLQVEFNPLTVEGYRLIGYENRRLQDEDFANDAKDGGEIGAGHSVTALYELIPAGSDELSGTSLAYQRTVPSGSDDFATVRVRYKQPDEDVSEELAWAVGADALRESPGDDFVLSAAVAAFGQLLMGSEFAGSADAQMILAMLQPMLSGDTGGQIVELSTLVRQSQGLY